MILLRVVLCFIFIVNIYGDSYVPPKIIRDPEVKDLVIDAGDNYTLTCEGSDYMEWTYPQTSEEKRKWTNFTNITVMPDETNPIYRSILHISNMSYPFVGYYTCRYSSMSEEQDQIYLYVNDTDHLSVQDSYNLIKSVQNRETTIPCRPTAPDIEVKLITYDTNEINTQFYPETGFTFKVSDIAFEDTYYCVFNRPRDDKLFELSLFLEITSARSDLPIPYIKDLSYNHTDVGQTLNLSCSLPEDSSLIQFNWKTPRGTYNQFSKSKSSDVVVESTVRPIRQKDILVSTLHVKNSKKEDTGTYSCIVSDQQNHTVDMQAAVVVHDINECYIEIKEENEVDIITVNASQPAQWKLDVIAHPVPDITWYDNEENLILKNNNNYHTKFHDNGTAVFRIKNVVLGNAGVYRVHGRVQRFQQRKRCQKEAEYEIMLIVNDKPSVSMKTPYGTNKATRNEMSYSFFANEVVEIECTAKGNPFPVIEWMEKTCLNEECKFVKVYGENKPTSEPYTVKESFEVNATRDATIKCVASNDLGSDESIISYYISDVKNGFDIYDFGPGSIVNTNQTAIEVIIAEHSIFSFKCGVSYKKSDNLEVFVNGEPLDERYLIMTTKSNLSKIIEVQLSNVQINDSGDYSCRIKKFQDHSYDYRNVTLTVKEPEQPLIIGTNLDREILVDYPKLRKELTCNAIGIPKPTIEWYKDNQLMVPFERIIIANDGRNLIFNYTELSDEGTYECKAFNSAGSTSKQAALKFKEKPQFVAISLYITGIIALLLIVAVVYIIVGIRKERKLRRELKLLGLENFHNGSPENLNPELGIDDQAELLPYDKKFEFPIERLKIGKQLGSGAFGVVLKAEAKGIIPEEPKTTVAVKMVKKNADQSYIKALASELKIMVHLGKHINVVNVLGACTKNVAKRELLVIVEFCRFGNLQNYIYKHRETYINQVDTFNGSIDYNIGADILERTYSVSSENCSSPVPSNSMQDYRERSHKLSTQLSTGEDSVILSNNSAQPEWRLNYKGDYRGDVKPISTRDLITWSFQVARGMEYLASRKVLHGDLAARNILLAENNVVKICDFGLAKTMYNDNNYKKKGNSPLPIKWMAIESIRDRVFSTQSDVWSFGIVLWEFFSLARTPYPGMEADERLYHKLVEGYRMESPPYAPKEIYTIMVDCWQSKALARPSFTRLAEKIGDLLEDSVRKHYVDLNDPYLKMNTERLEDDDYLAMLSPPSFDTLSTPPIHYSNAEAFPTHARGPKSSGYVSERYTFMGASEIFSPRSLSDDVFDFQNSKKREQHKSDSEEHSPMLTNSDEELEKKTGYLTPITPVNSVSNPLYNQLPTLKSKTQIKNHSELITTPDNYISMPEYKIIMNNSCKDSNGPSVKLDIEKANSHAHYVNDVADKRQYVNV